MKTIKVKVYIDNNNKYFKRKNYIKGIFSHGIFCQASKNYKYEK